MAVQRRRLGEILIEAGVLNEQQLTQALSIQKEDERRLGAILMAYGFVAEPQLVQALSRQLSVPWVSLWHVDVPEELLELVPLEIASECCAVPVYVRSDRDQGTSLYVAMDDPTNEEALQRVSQSAMMPVKAMVAGPSDIASAIKEFYGVTDAPPTTTQAKRIEASTVKLRKPDLDVEKPPKDLESQATLDLKIREEKESAEPQRKLTAEEGEPKSEPAPSSQEAALTAERSDRDTSENDAPIHSPSESGREVVTPDTAKSDPEVVSRDTAESDVPVHEIVTLDESHVVRHDEEAKPPVSVAAIDESEISVTDTIDEKLEIIEAAAKSEGEKQPISNGVMTLGPSHVVEDEEDLPRPGGSGATMFELDADVSELEKADGSVDEEVDVKDLQMESYIEEPSSTKPHPRRLRALALTLLDGTTIELKGSTHREEEKISSIPELVALLRASASGDPLPKPLPSNHWEVYIAHLIELLVSKRLLSEEEILERLIR